MSVRRALDPDETFLMIAIRNLYWTVRIAAFIVGGLIRLEHAVGVVGATLGVFATRDLGHCRWKLRATHKTGAFQR